MTEVTEKTTLDHITDPMSQRVEVDAWRLMTFLIPDILKGVSVEDAIERATTMNYNELCRKTGIDDGHSGFSFGFVVGRARNDLKSYVNGSNANRAEKQ